MKKRSRVIVVISIVILCMIFFGVGYFRGVGGKTFYLKDEKTSSSSSLSSDKSKESSETSSSFIQQITEATGENDLSANWSVDSAGSGPSTSNVGIFLTNISSKNIQVRSSKLQLIYTKPQNGNTNIQSSNDETFQLSPNESIKLNQIFLNISDQTALYGFSIQYNDHTIYTRAPDPSLNNNQDVSLEDPIKTDIYNQLVDRKKAAIDNNNNHPEGASRPVTEVHSLALSLKVKYPDYEGYIDKVVSDFGIGYNY